MHTNGSKQDSLESFMKSSAYGPLTGLSKLLSDLEFYTEVELLPKQIQQHAYHGIIACKGITLNKEALDEIEKKTSVTWKSAYNALDAILRLPLGQENRFYHLMRNYAKMEELFSTLKQNLLEEDLLCEVTNHIEDEQDKMKMQIINTQNRHKTLAQLLGITLAMGKLKQVKMYAAELKILPAMEEYEFGHNTRAVIEYLDAGGLQRLERRAAFSLGTNKYWWKLHTGEGSKLRQYSKEVVTDLTTNPITTFTYGVTATAGVWLMQRYGPMLFRFIENNLK